MMGYQLNFYTLHNREYQHHPIADWLIETAQGIGISGATVVHGDASYGSDGRIHSARFFEQAEQPMIIVMVVTDTQCDKMLELVQATGLKIFYTRAKVEYGYTNDDPSA